MNIVGHRKIYFAISILLFLASLVALILWGLKFSIDFTGGSLLEVEFLKERPSNQIITEWLADLNLGQVNIQPVEDKGVILRLKDIDENTHQGILEKLGRPDEIKEVSFESVGSLIGNELKRKTIWAIIIALIAIILYIAWAFRKVSKPVSSWQYGLMATVSLFHDVFITVGAFAVLGHFRGVEIDLPFIAALLTIVGFSVNNSIVVFDRARENLLKTRWDKFEEVINQSINQSLGRCINTSLTVLFTLLMIFFFGGQSIKYFALALIIGVVIGTFGAIFVAGSLVVAWQKFRQR